MTSPSTPVPIIPQPSAATRRRTAVRPIRRRLIILLMQAFGMVVLLTALLFLILIGLLLTMAMRGDANTDGFFTRPFAVYYLARGSWEGVGAIAEALPAGSSRTTEWQNVLLLDAEHRVVLDEGRADTDRVGTVYTAGRDSLQFPIEVQGRQVGTLVLLQQPVGAGQFILGLLVSLAVPISLISFFMGVLTLLIGFLLAQRVVSPLADVIAAAQAVTEGDLSTRVAVRGPSDLKSLSDSFNQMAETLENNDQDRRNWLADIAHELRTPLTVMRGKLEGILDGVYAAEEAHIAPVLSQTYLLERLVEDLRLLTLAETRQLHLDRQPTALPEVLTQVVGLFEAEAHERRIALETRIAPQLPCVLADAQRISQVIGNLLSNALHYIPEGSRVQLRLQASPGGVEIAVSDNGPGVPDEERSHLFDRFWRGEKSRTRAAGGAGLGLAIARQLVEAHGGWITARPAAAGGLEVLFFLPAAPPRPG